jgi:signal transduction histidine kinase
MASADADQVVPDGWPARLRVLFDAALDLAQPYERDTVLRRIVEGAASVADARYAALGVYDDAGLLGTFVHHGFDQDTVEAIGDYPQGRGLLGEVIVADAPVRLDDLGSHPSSCGFPPGHPAMSTFLGVPILRAGHRYGTLYLTEKARGEPFDETDESLVVALAAFAAGAIETTERIALERSRVAAEEQARSRRELLGQVIAAQEAERARVSRDLHDDVGQALTSVLLGLRLVEDSLGRPQIDADDARGRVADLRELVADGLRRTRQLAFDLRPTVLDDIGLVPALQRLTEDLSTRTGQTVELDTAALHPDERLPTEIETVIYRVVQEALTNVVRHASASTASVTLSDRDGQIRVFIEDDGIGFDPEHRPERTHLGVEGMRQRAELVDGNLSVVSTPGRGTLVLLEVARG